MKKRVLALLICLCMAVALFAGCGKEADTDTTDTDNTVTNNTTDTETADSGNEQTGDDSADVAVDEWTWPLAEQAEMSMWVQWSNNFNEDPNELFGIQQIEKNTNVHIDWVVVNSTEAAEKYGLMLASGDYPDVLLGGDSHYNGGAAQGVADGVFVDLTDKIEEYCPNYMALLASNDSLRKDVVNDAGQYSGFCAINSNFGVVSGERPWVGMTIRKDWLDELGLEVPVTIDDWHTVLTAFKEEMNCPAPMLTAADGTDLANNFLSAYGVLSGFYQENGAVKFGPAEAGYKSYLDLFQQWYAEGLIDQNFTSNDAMMMNTNEIATGQAGACNNFYSFTGEYMKAMGFATDEDYMLVACPTPVLNEGDTPQLGFNMSALTGSTTVITNNCEDVELAMRYIDYWYSEECMLLDSVGIEGDSYVKNDDGSISLTDKLKDQVATGEYPTLGDALNNYTLGTSAFGLTNWGRFNLMYEGDPSLEAYDIWAPSQYDLVLPSKMSMTEEESATYYTMYTNLSTLVNEFTVQYIMGEKTDADYETFLTQLTEFGLDECITIQQAALDRYNAR